MKIAKKYRYLIHAGIMGGYIALAALIYWNANFYIRLSFGLLLVSISTLFVHYPNFGKKWLRNAFMALVQPVFLLASILLALKYYPNLSLSFKLLTVLASSVMFYVIALVDNIFLVVSGREEIIPLYRAAIPWSQILLVSVSIPLYTGIFKIPTYFYVQTLVTAGVAFILALYQFWSYRFEDNTVVVGVGETIMISGLSAFFVLSLGIATSFIPTESFLRGLVSSTGLMFGLFYLSSYLKNNINKGELLKYFMIIVSFIGLCFIYQ